MAGTVGGGKLAAQTNKKLYGEGFYRGIGKMGGLASRGGGFASMTAGADGLTGPERAIEAGRRGGQAKPKRKVAAQ